MDEFKIPVAATPPTQPATPPDRSATDARDREIRHRALQCAIQLMVNYDITPTDVFWSNVTTFERYIRTGEHTERTEA